MLLYLFLGFVLGAAVVGALAWRQHQRTRRAVQQVAQALAVVSTAPLGALPVGPHQAAEVAELVHNLNLLLVRLEKDVAAQRQFVSHSSHQLRTPLTFIKGKIEVALLKPRSAAEHEQTLRAVLQDVSGLARLSNDLLLLNQLNADHYRLSAQPVDLDEVLFQASQQLKTQHPEYQVQLVFDSQLEELTGPLTVAGDADLLEQACLHLLRNGGQFASDGQVHVLVTVAEQQASLQFRNSGAGISPADAPRLFEPFFRGDKGRIQAGNGLGLSVVQRVAALHRGGIRVDSAPDQDTTFILTLPLAT